MDIAATEVVMFLQLFIINRSGGLIYNKNLSSFAPNLSTNDCLRLGKYDRGTSNIIFIISGTDTDTYLLIMLCSTIGSTFHGLHAIIPQIAPILSSGIERLETDSFVLQSLQTLTGVKFVITAKPGTVELLELLQSMYEIYSDFVLKVRS